MRRRKIKHLGKRNVRRNNYIKYLIKISILPILLIMIFVNLFTGREEEVIDLKGVKDVSKEVTLFYINIADEVGEYKTQISWQELIAIDLVRYKDDLGSIDRDDIIKLGQKFIKKEHDKDGEVIYKVKKLDNVLDDLDFTKSQKKEVNSYLEKLKYVSISKSSLIKEEEKIKFIEEIVKYTNEIYEKYNILPSIVVSQAILESGWGQSTLTKDSNNIFGIKADKKWNGDEIEVMTTENYNDKTEASFRKYKSLKESIRDYAKFLDENKRYRENGLFEAKHYKTQAQALEDAGYSTKKNDKGELVYADVLIDLIKNYNLQLLDREVQTEK